MAVTLTDVAIKTRKSIRWGIYFIIFILVARFAISSGRSIKNTFFPAPPPPPTVGFDVLPAIQFPQYSQALPQLSVSVETPTGTLPEFPESLPVYFMPKALPTLNSVDVAKSRARNLGFKSDPIEISQTVYRFDHPTDPSSLTMNIVWETFSIAYDLASDPSPIQKNPPHPEAAVNQVNTLLRNANSLPADLTGPTPHEFLKVESQKLVQAISLSEADLIKVNLYRKNFGSEDNPIPVVTKDPNEANVWFIISGTGQIIAGEFHYYPIDEEKVHTYPIKTAAQALEDLKAGRAYIASLGLNQDGAVIVRDIYLAYYDPDINSEFFQPVIVFKGDDNFLAYVPAVTDQYYEVPAPPTKEPQPTQ